MESPILSVVIPVYNAEQFIRRATDSVLKQPCTDRIELILVDDGSTDGSGQICDQIAAEAVVPVRVFHQNNSGVSSARNLGIREARGAYLAFLDADDWWVPEFFNAHLVGMLEEDYDVLQFSYISVSSDCKWCLEHHTQNETLHNLNPDASRPYPVTHWSCLYRRDHLLKHEIRYLHCKINEDVPFIHLAFTFASSIKRSDHMMLCYWSNPNSSRRSVRSTLEEALKSLELEEQAFRDKGIQISNARAALYVFYTRLPRLCCQMSYGQLREYLKDDRFDFLQQADLEPWGDRLQKRAKSYKQHPFLFWLKARVSPGFPLALRRLLLAIPSLRHVVYFVHFRVLLHWNKYNGGRQTK